MEERQSSANRVQCAICGGTHTRTLYVKSGYNIGRCVQCGLVYVNPRAPKEVIGARYNSEYFTNEYLPALGVVDGSYDLNYFDERYAPLLKMLETASGRRLVEIGSGAGFFLKSAERRGWQVTGVEVSEVASRFATDRLGLQVHHAPAESISLPAASFDAAVMLDTIEHLFDPTAALTAVARALAPGGLLLIGTPNFGALSLWLLGPSWAVLSPLEHVYYFDEQSLRRVLEKCGFEGIQFVRRHPEWTPQETMNFVYTHAPRSMRSRFAALVCRVGGHPLARQIQRAGLQDILLCLGRRSTAGAPPLCH